MCDNAIHQDLWKPIKRDNEDNAAERFENRAAEQGIIEYILTASSDAESDLESRTAFVGVHDLH